MRRSKKEDHRWKRRFYFKTDIEKRKRREQLGLGTQLVYAVNDESFFFFSEKVLLI